MAIDFPNTPVTNDTFSSGTTTWKYDGTKWDVLSSSSLATTGDKGGVKYTYSSTTTDADPGNGFFRYNNATIGSVTFIYIDNVNAGAVSMVNWYATWDDSSSTVERGFLTITDNSSNNVNVFRITGNVTAATGYYKIPVAYSSGVALTNAGTYLIEFNRSGETGPSGTLAVGTVTTGAAGSSVIVTNVGTSTAATLDFTIPRGDTGLAATATAGTTSTGLPNTNASVANSGTTSAAVFDFTVPRGDIGGIPYTFSTTTTDADPGNGNIRYNSATMASITFIYIDNLDNLGNTLTAWYDTWDDSTSTPRGTLTLIRNGGTTVNVFDVTGPVTVASGYYKIPVSFSSGTLPANSSEMMIHFARAGEQGNPGITVSGTAPGSPTTNDLWLQI